METPKYTMCHKCGGNLSARQSPLYCCGCMSSWIRGFEDVLPMPEAIDHQIEACESRLRLFIRQGREESRLSEVRKEITRLTEAK